MSQDAPRWMTNGPLVWTPPPGWPAAPQGWEPPVGWAPSPEWPPAPVGWQWWQPGLPHKESGVAFHLLGVFALGCAAVAYCWFGFAVAVAVGSCDANPEAAFEMRTGAVILSVAALSVPVSWARVAFRKGHAWWPWLFVSLFSALILVSVAVELLGPAHC